MPEIPNSPKSLIEIDKTYLSSIRPNKEIMMQQNNGKLNPYIIKYKIEESKTIRPPE